MTHTISLLVENHQGVLARISGLFSGRAYNLESLTVGVTADSSISRITLVCSGDDNVIEQIKKQLNKLVDVIKLTDLTGLPAVHRELALIKVSASPSQRGEIVQVVDVFRGKIVDVGSDSMVIEATGSTEKIDDMLTILSAYTVLEIARSGLISIERGKKIKKVLKGV
ncbi:MAG: acetolactate synthase small subunit [Spirochaetales bacterium]|nr:acetolactate synthase small subunit [Spirochaetales bacterium]